MTYFFCLSSPELQILLLPKLFFFLFIVCHFFFCHPGHWEALFQHHSSKFFPQHSHQVYGKRCVKEETVLLQSPQWCSVLPVLIPQTGYHLVSWITKPHWVSPPLPPPPTPHMHPSPQADCHDNPTLNPSLWTLMLEVLTRTASRKGPGTLRLRSPLAWGT